MSETLMRVVMALALASWTAYFIKVVWDIIDPEE